MVHVQRSGTYRLTLRQLPEEADHVLVAKRARVQIADQVFERDITAGAHSVTFEIELHMGKTKLQTWLYPEQGPAGGAYFVEVEWLNR